jgi:hypothetical protein
MFRLATLAELTELVSEHNESAGYDARPERDLSRSSSSPR